MVRKKEIVWREMMSGGLLNQLSGHYDFLVLGISHLLSSDKMWQLEIWCVEDEPMSDGSMVPMRTRIFHGSRLSFEVAKECAKVLAPILVRDNPSYKRE